MVNGRHVEHWVNDTLVLALELDDPHVVERVEKRWSRIPEVLERYSERRDKPSPIALQNHGDSTVWFRNLELSHYVWIALTSTLLRCPSTTTMPLSVTW